MDYYSLINHSLTRHGLQFSLVFVLCATGLGAAAEAPPAAASPQSEAATLAATPPMGWNSWDGYGTTVKEADVKANAQWLADHLKPLGWQYVVVDMEWYRHQSAGGGQLQDFGLQHGQLRPLYAGGEPVSFGGE